MAEREIKITILGDAKGAQSALTSAGSAVGTFEGKIEGAGSKLAGFGSVMSGVLAAGAVQKLGGLLIDGAKGAAEDAAAMDRLAVAVENTGVSFESRSQAVDDAIKKGQELAFSDGEVMMALTSLTTATGDSDEAMRRLTLAQDLARGTGMSLEAAAKLLGKTSDENTATLKRYGITVSDTATAQDVLNEVDKRFGGQAAAFAESDAGKWAQFQLQLTEVQETIGGALIPVFTLLATVGLQVASVIGEQIVPAIKSAAEVAWIFIEPIASLVGDYMEPLLVGLGAIATVIVASFVPAAIAWAASMIPVVAQHIALAAAAVITYAPIIAALALVGVTVAALYLAWQSNFLGIQDITKSVIDFVSPYITTAIEAIKVVFETVWPIISAVVDVAMQAISLYVTTYIGAIKATVETVLPAVQVVFETVWDAIKLYVEAVLILINAAVQVGMFAMKDIVGPILGAIELLFSEAWGRIQTVIDTIAGPAGTAVDAVSDGMDAAKGAVDSVLGTIEGLFTDAWGRVEGTVRGVTDTITGLINGVIGAINGVIGGWNGFAGAFNSLPDIKIGGGSFMGQDLPSLTIGFPSLPTFGYLGGGGGGGGGGGVGGYHALSAGGGPGGGGPGGGPGGVSGGPPGTGPQPKPPIHEDMPIYGGGGGGGGGGTKPNPHPPGELPPVVVDPVTGEVYSTLGANTHTVSGHQGSGSRAGGNAFAGTRVYATGSPEHRPDSLGRPWGDPCWGKLASCEVEMAAAAHATANANNRFMYQGGGQGSFQGQSSLRDRDVHAYAEKHGGVVLSSGLVGYDASQFNAGGNVFLDGRKVGKFLGFRHRREAFSLRDPVGGCS